MSINGSFREPMPPSSQVEGLSKDIPINPGELSEEEQETLTQLAALDAELNHGVQQRDQESSQLSHLAREKETSSAGVGSGLVRDVTSAISGQEIANSIDHFHEMEFHTDSEGQKVGRMSQRLDVPTESHSELMKLLDGGQDLEEVMKLLGRQGPERSRQFEGFVKLFKENRLGIQFKDRRIMTVGQKCDRLEERDENGHYRAVDPNRYRGAISQDEARVLISAYVANQVAIRELQHQQNEERRRAREAAERASHQLHHPVTQRNIDHVDDKESAGQAVRKTIAANREALALQFAKKEGEIQSLMLHNQKSKKQIDKARKLIKEAIDITHEIRNEETIVRAQQLLDQAARSLHQEHQLVPVQSKQMLPGGAIRITVFNKALGKAVLQARNIYIADKGNNLEDSPTRSPDKHVFRHMHGNIHFARPLTRRNIRD